MINYIKFNSLRKKEYQLMTLMKNVKGENIFIKKAVDDNARQFLLSLIDKYKILCKEDNFPFHIVKPIKINDSELGFKYIEGHTFRAHIENLIRNNRYSEAINFIDNKFIHKIRGFSVPGQYKRNKAFEDIFGEHLSKENSWLNVGILDLIFDNLVISGSSKKVYLIDYEWTWDFALPVDYVIFRSLYMLLYQLKINQYDISPLYENYRGLFLERYIKSEYSFSKYVHKDIVSYRAFKMHIFDGIKFNRVLKNHIVDVYTQNNNLNNVINTLELQIQRLESQLNSVSKEESRLRQIVQDNEKQIINLQDILKRRSVRIAIKLGDWISSLIRVLK